MIVEPGPGPAIARLFPVPGHVAQLPPGHPGRLVRVQSRSAGLAFELLLVKPELFGQLPVELVPAKPIPQSRKPFSHDTLDVTWELRRVP